MNAPIALFVYNRIDHTRKTIEALQRNVLSTDSELFIFSDAAKNASSLEDVDAVRAYINTISGFKKITIIKRLENWGLAQSIIGGVTDLCNLYERVIVVEDDVVTSPYFLNFMNTALNQYAEIDTVKHISGYMFPLPLTDEVEDTFLLRVASCWGWATWKRSWQNFEPDAKKLLSEIESKGLVFEFDLNDSIGYRNMLRDQSVGKVSSWAVRWYASIFLQNGLCLHPKYSLVNNIGHDGTGENCSVNETYTVEIHNNIINVKKLNKIGENSLVFNYLVNFNFSSKPSYYKRLVQRINLDIAQLIRKFRHI